MKNHLENNKFIWPLFLFLSTPLLAESVVTGNLIDWPDDGWYQVQRADNFSTVCEGGSFCEVTAGTYIVINHTTGLDHLF